MRAKVSPELSHRIANLGFLCTLLVVSIHLRNVPVQVGSMPWVLHHVVRYCLAIVAVPYFFIVSGYFLSRHVGEPGWWRRAVVQRLRTIGIPFFAWCLIPLLLFSVFWTAGDPGGECSRVTFRASSVAAALGLNLFTSPEANRPLWYLRALMMLTVISPVLAWTLRKSRGWALILFACVWWSLNPGSLEFTGFWLNLRWQIFFVFGFTVEGLVFFSLGLFLGQRSFHLRRRSGLTLGAVGLVIGLVGLALRMNGIQGWSYCAMASILPVLGGLWVLTPQKAGPGWLIGSAFSVYVVHSIMIRTVNVLGIVPKGTFAGVLEWTIVVVLSFLVAIVLHKGLPRISEVVFGGR